MIRVCGAEDFEKILKIINAAAAVYEGRIPDECWGDPYLSRDELAREIADGIVFYGYEDTGSLVGVMGIQEKSDVTLIRHAYVMPAYQGQGIGGKLIKYLLGLARSARILVGTWQSNTEAITFYQKHGFMRLPHNESMALLEQYWTITPLHAETSLVLELKHQPKP